MPSPKFPPPPAGRLVTNLNKKRKALESTEQRKRVKLIQQTGNIAFDSAVVVAFKRVDWHAKEDPGALPSPKFPPPLAGRLITNLNKKRKAQQDNEQCKRMKLTQQTGNIAYDSAVVVAFKRVDWHARDQPVVKRALQSPPCSPTSSEIIEQTGKVASDLEVDVDVAFMRIDWHGKNQPQAQQILQTVSYSPMSSRFLAPSPYEWYVKC